MGLVARALEEVGIPTVSLTSAWSITASANPPRAVYTDFPLGNTAGPPGDAEMQLTIVNDALAAFNTITESGTILSTPHVWPEPWRDEARELRDHRTERLDTPQYQTAEDLAAAVANHGEGPACGAC